MRRAARQRGWDDEKVDDLVQDAMLKAIKAIPKFKGESQPSTWLYRIATGLVVDAIRRESVEVAYRHRLLLQGSPSSESPIDRLVLRETIREVYEAIDSPILRRLFVHCLGYGGDLEYVAYKMVSEFGGVWTPRRVSAALSMIAREIRTKGILHG